MNRKMFFWKSSVLVVFLFLEFLVSAQSFTNLKKIESSTNYLQNITLLKNQLKSCTKISPRYLEVSKLLVKNYLHSNNYQAAQKHCHENILLSKKYKSKLAEAIYDKLLGNTYYYLKQIDKALFYWRKCVIISVENNYYSLSKNCYNNFAAIEIEKLNYIKAEEFLLKAIEFGKKEK